MYCFVTMYCFIVMYFFVIPCFFIEIMPPLTAQRLILCNRIFRCHVMMIDIDRLAVIIRYGFDNWRSCDFTGGWWCRHMYYIGNDINLFCASTGLIAKINVSTLIGALVNFLSTGASSK